MKRVYPAWDLGKLCLTRQREDSIIHLVGEVKFTHSVTSKFKQKVKIRL